MGPLLEQFRQSVLAAAFRGDLTADWRAAHPDVEPASELLYRIRAERRRRWEQAELAKYEAKGQKPPKNWQDKYEEPEPVDAAALPTLPIGWEWVRVKDIGAVQLGRQRAPQYHSGPNMRPYLRVMNVFEDRIDTEDIMEMDFSPEEFERYRLEPEDILLNEGQSRELVGRSAIYRGEIPGACFTNTLVRFRPDTPIESDYPQIVFLGYLKTELISAARIAYRQYCAPWCWSLCRYGISTSASGGTGGNCQASTWGTQSDYSDGRAVVCKLRRPRPARPIHSRKSLPWRIGTSGP